MFSFGVIFVFIIAFLTFRWEKRFIIDKFLSAEAINIETAVSLAHIKIRRYVWIVSFLEREKVLVKINNDKYFVDKSKIG